jgi:deacetoxycephalosporin-C synthase
MTRSGGESVKGSTVPIFSLAELQKDDYSDQLFSCVKNVGAFYLLDYGLSELDHKLARDTAMRFFQESSEEERTSITCADPKVRRGYSRLESESTAKVTNTGSYSDFSMGYSMGISDNLFPSPDFEKTFNLYFRKLYTAAQETAREVLKSIGHGTEENLSQVLECDPVLRFRYFPDVPEDRGAEQVPLRMAPHYDLSIVTLIHQTPSANGVASLQCEVEGVFVDLPPIPNSSVVICGAVSTIISGGKIKAPKHQVAAPSTKDRVGSSRTSSVFFLRPEPDFTFSVPLAKAFGLDINLSGDTATFKDWIGGNYTNMRSAVAKPAAECAQLSVRGEGQLAKL